jgi:phenylacetate-CoA ligase
VIVISLNIIYSGSLMFRKFCFSLGVYFRNPSFKSAYKELKDNEFASKSDLERVQSIRLRSLLVFAKSHSPFYKNLLSEIQIPPDEDFDISVLKKIPFLYKRDLLAKNELIHTNNSFVFNRLFYSETSGSTGEALTFFKDEKWDSFHRASIARGLSWYGVSPWQRRGYLWGYSFNKLQAVKTKIFDVLVNRFRLFSYSDKSVKVFLRKLRNAEYIEGYSSMLYEIAKISNANGLTFKNLKVVKGTSEKIFDHYHKESMLAFGHRIVSEYGSAEAGIIAFECPFGNMHINEETCIVEVVDSEIVVTNLVSYSFPIIRYKLGDYVTLSSSACKCGRSHSVIESVLGRVGRSVYGLNNTKFPSLTLYYIFKRLAIEHSLQLNYKAEQSEVGRLLIKISNNLSEANILLIKKIARDYFESFVAVDVICGVEIRQYNKKKIDFESFLTNV